MACHLCIAKNGCFDKSDTDFEYHINMSTSHSKRADNAESKSVWIKTPVANLIKYKPSGVFFARVRLRNRLYRSSLKTTVMSVAKLKLADFVKERQALSPDGEILGKMTMGDAI